jgi:hypothetical protein
MRRRLRSVLPVVLVPALYASAQEPPPPVPQPPVVAPPVVAPPVEPTPPPKQQPPAPVDPTNAAAEMLRRRLGLHPGPGGTPPAGPPKVPSADAPAPVAPVAPEPPPEQEPQEPQAAPPADPTEAAKRALERMLPRAHPPAAAPIPNASGTPEPIAPGAAPIDTGNERREPPAETAVPWSGTLSSRYRARHGAGATDQDLVARLSVDIGRREHDAFTFHVSARGFADLDGRSSNGAFSGLDHSFGDDVHGYLYRAHLDAHELPHLELARLGRQDLDETPTPVSFDGLRVDSERFGQRHVWLSAYGGVPVHQFAASRNGDGVYGLALGGNPWSGARVRVDWMDLKDEFLALDRHDALLGARWWQNVGDVQLHGLHTWRDGTPRDLQVGARGQIAEPVQFTCDYRELLRTQRAEVTQLDPFYAIAFEYVPYRQLEATLSGDLDDHVGVAVGSEIRRLSDRNDERAFNREFEHYHADLTLQDLGVKGLSLTLSGNLWQSTGEAFRAVAGDLEYRPDRDLRLTLGSAYDLFRYDAFDDRERLHVRSWHLRADRRVGAALRVDGSYEYERSDDDEFHQFRLGVTWTF